MNCKLDLQALSFNSIQATLKSDLSLNKLQSLVKIFIQDPKLGPDRLEENNGLQTLAELKSEAGNQVAIVA